jgi:hypothetical protein
VADTQSKSWYTRWWGIIIAILILPYFLIWFFWAKTKWSTRRKILATVAVPILSVPLLIVDGAMLSALSGGSTQQPVSTSNVAAKSPVKKTAPSIRTSKKSTSTTAKPANTPTSSTTATTSQAPTESIATLNAQAVALFNPVLTDFEQQMSQGQADAAQSNAASVSSSWHSWETDEQDSKNVSNNNEVTTAYNKADNAYFNAHQTAPAALDNWDTDAGDIPGDISNWANDEQLVIGDELFGNSSTSDRQLCSNTRQT